MLNALKEPRKNFYDLIQPVTAKLEIKKRSPLHPYFTSQPSSLIQSYVQNFSQPGDIVADLFGGSGTTLRESLLLGRSAIHVDLMPWSCFIAKNSSLKPSVLSNVDETFEAIRKNVRDEIVGLYMKSDRQIEKMGLPKNFPNNIVLPSSSDVENLVDLFTPRNRWALMILIDEINKVTNPDHKGFLEFIFSGILARSSKTYWKDKAGKGGGDSSVFKVYRYWIPKDYDERNVWDLFEFRYRRVLKTLRQDNKILDIRGPPADFVCQSSTDLKNKIKSNSVDYIYTDPPYAKHITYLDLSTMYNAFLGFEITQQMRQQEAIEGGDNQKNRNEYCQLIDQSFAEAFRVLKPNRWMTLVFTHKDPSVFTRIVEGAEKAGFTFVNAVSQATARPTFHKINNTVTVLRGQMMINFKKEGPFKTSKRPTRRLDSEQSALIHFAQVVMADKNGRANLSDLIHELYERLLAAGYIKDIQADFVQIQKTMDQYFEKRIEKGEVIYYSPKTTKSPVVSLSSSKRPSSRSK